MREKEIPSSDQVCSYEFYIRLSIVLHLLIITVIALRKKGMEILQKKNLSNLPILNSRGIDFSFKRFSLKNSNRRLNFKEEILPKSLFCSGFLT